MSRNFEQGVDWLSGDWDTWYYNEEGISDITIGINGNFMIGWRWNFKSEMIEQVGIPTAHIIYSDSFICLCLSEVHTVNVDSLNHPCEWDHAFIKCKPWFIIFERCCNDTDTYYFFTESTIITQSTIYPVSGNYLPNSMHML